MGRCCDGKNAYKPISKIRYLACFLIFYFLHLNLKIILYIRHTFLKKYTNYNELVKFHRAYFRATMKEILNQKGLVVKSRCNIRK